MFQISRKRKHTWKPRSWKPLLKVDTSSGDDEGNTSYDSSSHDGCVNEVSEFSDGYSNDSTVDLNHGNDADDVDEDNNKDETETAIILPQNADIGICSGMPDILMVAALMLYVLKSGINASAIGGVIQLFQVNFTKLTISAIYIK
jgi:hypothetical protein